jgi:hypothetical protein
MKLPYYKFMVQDWLSGDVQAMSLTHQAIFTNLCAIIWKDGGVYSKPIAVLQHRCRIDETELQEALDNMKELGIIYVDDNGYLRVKFIDEQIQELTQAHEQKVLAGKLGAEAKRNKHSYSTAIAPLKHTDTDTDTDSITPKGITDADFWTELKSIYTWIDMEQEQARMRAWLMTPRGKRRKLTRAFAVNWLNKVDKPLHDGISEVERKARELRKNL